VAAAGNIGPFCLSIVTKQSSKNPSSSLMQNNLVLYSRCFGNTVVFFFIYLFIIIFFYGEPLCLIYCIIKIMLVYTTIQMYGVS